MFRYIAFADEVLLRLENDVASHPPERGGALLGPVGQPIVSRFLFDSRAQTSGSTYTPSVLLQERVAEAEKSDSTLELKGIVHSHPGDMRHPSSGDLRAFADSLNGAPWLGRFIAPIITRTRSNAEHDVPLRSGVMSVFIAERGHERVELQPGIPHVVPIRTDIDRLQRALGGTTGLLTTVEIEGTVYVSSSLRIGGLDLQLLVGPNYPFTAPIVLLTNSEADAESKKYDNPAVRLLASFSVTGSTVAIPIVWDQSASDSERLVSALAVSTSHVASPVVTLPSHDARRGIRERLQEVTSSALPSKRVLVVGAGSGGSTTADGLVRSGIEYLTVIDPEKVGFENLSRSIYTTVDVGSYKVDALKRHLTNINPRLQCTTFANELSDLSSTDLATLISESDLVVAATDDPAAQRAINHFSYFLGIPSLYAGVYAKGHAGEVVVVVPEITKCYRCTTSSRHSGAESERHADYGTGRLKGEPALGSDIAHVVTASVKLALGLLELEEGGSSHDFMIDCLSAGYNYLILSMVPNWGFFPGIFKDVADQYAFQSVWLSAAGDPSCPVCGTERIDPLATTTARAPRVAELRPVGSSPAPTALSEPKPKRKRRVRR